MKPPFSYYGGKTTLAPQIAALLPPHEHYVEPFAGSLAVLLAKQPSRAETVNDLDGDLMTFWRMLRDRASDLQRVCSLTPHARAEHRDAADLNFPPDDLERARRVWVLLTQSRTHSLRAKNGWWNTKSASIGTPPAAYIKSYASRMEQCASRLSQVTLESRDAIELIRDYGSEPAVCLYVDPPYLGSTRATGYRVEMLGEDAHRDFADALNGCKASVVLSGYDSPLYAELFDGWHRLDIAAPATLTNATDRVEVLWSNRPLGEPNLLDMIDDLGA